MKRQLNKVMALAGAAILTFSLAGCSGSANETTAATTAAAAGINVFPSQVESVILDMPQFEPQYMLVVDRKNNLDSLQVQVEVRKDFFSDDMGRMLAMKKALSDKLKSVLSISAEVKLMEPNSIARSEGKSKRVIDNRILK